jgi:hypothetical protein
MSIEYTLAQFESSLARISVRPATVAAPSRAWWSLTQTVLGGLLLLYLAGLIQDFERVRDLRAEPLPTSMVIITKNQAWERVHPRPARPRAMAAAGPSWRHDEATPSGDPPEDAALAMMSL